jgi:hypothetical protein
MGWLGTLGEELGFGHIARSHSRRDVALLFVSRFIRMAGCVPSIAEDDSDDALTSEIFEASAGLPRC